MKLAFFLKKMYFFEFFYICMERHFLTSKFRIFLFHFLYRISEKKFNKYKTSMWEIEIHFANYLKKSPNEFESFHKPDIFLYRITNTNPSWKNGFEFIRQIP